MQRPVADQFMLALTAWRENRGGGRVGMQSVMNCIMNRTKKNHTTPYHECINKNAFTSVSNHDDPETTLYADQDKSSPQDWSNWLTALSMAAIVDDLPDITSGSTLYYNPKSIYKIGQTPAKQIVINGTLVPFPETWNEGVVHFKASIANQLFFTES